MRALLHAVPYTAQNFEVENERNLIMQKIFEALNCKDSEIRESAMQVLVEVGRQEYEYVEYYFPQIAQVTAYVANNDESKVGAQGIEFWTTLAEEELSRLKQNRLCKNYIHNCKSDLIALLLNGIKNV